MKTKEAVSFLTDVQRYEVGKKAAVRGTINTLRYYPEHFPKLPLTEPTVWQFKGEYSEFVKDVPKGKKREMPHKKKQSRPLLLGNELDRQVREYVC